MAEGAGRRQEVAHIGFVRVKMRRNEERRRGEHRGVRMFSWEAIFLFFVKIKLIPEGWELETSHKWRGFKLLRIGGKLETWGYQVHFL